VKLVSQSYFHYIATFNTIVIVSDRYFCLY